ncbi:MAG: pyridoxal phosphate enzyme YggS [Desulfobulbaceae bacterium]|jgi:pyridoxal phosphate enzyme (YggS family)|nr:MAG: pyridoxal phosphate enzyme YggS [Desulfobulbaceae bacterium]
MILSNLQTIRLQIQETASKCGRDPAAIRLVAVSKKCPVSSLQEAMQADQFLFGENYIQEAVQKKAATGGVALFHFIGHLQSNKVRPAAQTFQMIETIDRFKLAAALDKELKLQGKIMDILVQVNIGREPQKSGVLPEDTEKLFTQIIPLSNLRIQGLMTIPPFVEDPEQTRPYFRDLRLLAEKLQEKKYFFDNTHVELSMGMSSDYVIAIEEGATLVRVGTAIFGNRPEK